MPSYQNVVNKAIDYVARNLEGNDDLYSLAVASYALQLANHNSKNYILQTFDSRATRKGKNLHTFLAQAEEINQNLEFQVT